jgi:DNA-binding NarL/FixJ family response regulator
MSLLQTIRVVLADDHAMIREALSQMLGTESDIHVVGQAAGGEELLRVAARQKATVVVLDYSMPGLDAGTIIRRLLADNAALRILVLTFHENIQYALSVIEAGAHGFVVKSAAAQELVEGIRTVARGETFISPHVSHRLVAHLGKRKQDRAGLEALSQREFEVLRLLGTGLSLKECAKQLDVSVSAASTYRARLMEKLNLQTTAELIRFALEHQIVG